MKKLFFFAVLSLILSCNNDDGRSCTTCSSEVTANFELCEESNGTASVNGENTGVQYDIYIYNLIETGVSCDN
ncbi:hypothetical protein [Aequorivita echinoideorum]|uniref:Uncharacterized protein n=1 Tax=Aequorivita echinoideorum TaxID=1549647 RepID=A0ABS5S1M3_9FLAO|nr:hypothetical protein [Aequorivita echinoideorum]MBT0607116.1 hypothetical protein [Aequorivita echinoideorum]